MTQAGKVAEIFSTAGEAFSKLGQLALSLQTSTDHSQSDISKWGDEEINMLKKAVQQFGNDIEQVSERVVNKSNVQAKSVMKKKAMQNVTDNNSSMAKTISHGSPVKIQQATVHRIIGQKSRASESLNISDVQKKSKVDLPVNLNILTSIPQIKNLGARQNTASLPIVASNQGFQVLLPQKTVPPVIRTSIPGVSAVIGTNSVVLPLTTLSSLPAGSISVSTPGWSTYKTNAQLASLSSTNTTQSNIDSSNNVDVES